MSDQQPQQPGWAGPQQPHGQQPYGQPPFPPQQPPKKGPGAGKIIGLGCAGAIGLVVVIGIAAAVTSGSGSGDSKTSADTKTTASTQKDDKAAAGTGKSSSKKNDTPKTAAKVVTFKVWGTAPAGTLGPLDISYGSDSDTRKGTFKNGKFETTLTLNKDAMYYMVTAQLQGSGDINCSVTVDGKTKNGHASGGYNICNAQLSEDFTGGWQ